MKGRPNVLWYCSDQQRFDTIVPHSLEEVYELVDAIEANDLNQVRQELGDVLFQVVFYRLRIVRFPHTRSTLLVTVGTAWHDS